MGVIIVAGSAILLLTGYVLYGRRVGRWLKIDDHTVTPAHRLRDDVDYVPARRAVLLGHHFASIAGAAPIIGPITAAVFGWVPVLAWILIGGIFAGAVHDMSSLIASARHDGRSIGHIIERYVGDRAKVLFLLFAWATLVLIIGVFTILVARTFEATPAAATSSILFIGVAVLFGMLIYRKGMGLGAATVYGIVGLAGCLILGNEFPIRMSSTAWTYLLLVYVFAASVTPVWILLQPRDYLSSFLLYAMLGGAVAGFFFSRPAVHLPALGSFDDPVLGTMFPVLFVTVACGAISGFHSLVASGTSAKQLDRESDARVVGYGGMLIESLLAVIALATAFSLSRTAYLEGVKNPIALFAAGVAGWMARLGMPVELGTVFVSLAVAAFALTSLDTATRLARFVFQELVSGSDRQNPIPRIAQGRYVATAITVAAGGILALSGAWKAIWPIFGSANQLLAALALTAVAVWLTRSNMKVSFVAGPLVFMLVVTVGSLVTLSYRHLLISGNILLGALALVLLILALGLVASAGMSFFRRTGDGEARRDQ